MSAILHGLGPVVTRFAPSPTGALHLGSAAAAWTAWRRARAAGGRFLLRLEDIDGTRCRAEHAAAIAADLAWLGLGWDGAVRVQSAHFAEYRSALDELTAAGLLFPCFCTRADIAQAASAPHGPEGVVYPGACRRLDKGLVAERLAAGMPHALRLDMAAALRRAPVLTWFEEGEGRVPCDPGAFGDVVLARKEVPASYHLCVTHDDAAQGVTLVTRGEDLRAATSVHRLLQALLGWPEPGYAHHALLVDEAGRRLAKRDAALSISALREAGWSAGDVIGRVEAALSASRRS